MIELNLVPDVKQELLQAQRARTTIISLAILVSAVSVGVVVLLSIYLFVGLTVRNGFADDAIKSKTKTLQSIPDISDTLTIQNQLSLLSSMHDNKNIDSRFFAILAAINPPAPNSIVISSAKIDAGSKTITIDGQASNGYQAAEQFKKTILSTTMAYKDSSGAQQKVQLTDTVSTSDISYGEDASGKKVLRFTISFNYPDAIFARLSTSAVIQRPDLQDVTDSYLRVPQSLFSNRASDLGGGK